MTGAATVVTDSVGDEHSDQLHNLVETLLMTSPSIGTLSTVVLSNGACAIEP